ncbi:MAG TPA: DNA mismatch repair endonuclease MutL [Thermoplasmata archaeon]|nr:DNA mismatch repair endonuclease MutL [Thermoplasmata archaeon]
MSAGGVPTRRPIRRLAPATVERIAAGEVVERPASVVKELLENSLDAGAAHVTVRVENGGLDRIELADDGSGIPPEELELAVERHATNKLDPEGPVERISSLGFRGEALASVGTVSRLRLLSRAPGQDAASGLSVVGGAVVGRFEAPRAPGTTVEVESLFFNTPARLKFLKSPAAELVELLQAVERTYLARPATTYRVESEGREVANYPATHVLKDAAARVLGPELLHAFASVTGELPGGRVYGVVGLPSVSSSSTRGTFLAVNGRPVVSRVLAQAVRNAFEDRLPKSRFPLAVLHLEVADDRVDVNVHPTKREVRFVREREVADALRLRVREAILSAPAVAEAPGTRLVPAVPLDAAPAVSREIPPEEVLAGPLQRTLDEPGAPLPRTSVPTAGTHPRLDLLGCLDALYWVAATDDGIVLIDQHAASERILYEALRREGVLGRQALVDPVVLELSGVQRATLLEHDREVRAAGFEVEAFGPATHRVLAVPSYRGRRAPAEALLALLGELAGGLRPTVPDGLEERRAATIACHAAIRAGDPVARDEMVRLMEALYALPESAYACPHGRPILVRLSRARLDRWFLRSGA